MTVQAIGPVMIAADPGNVEDWVSRLKCLGFMDAGDAQETEWQEEGHVLAKGQARIAVGVVRPGTAAADRVAVCGYTFTGVALYTDDVPAAYRTAVDAGARHIAEPVAWLLSNPPLLMASAGGIGMTHTLYPAGAAHVRGPDVPGAASLPRIAGVSLAVADAAAVKEAAEFYERAYGFKCEEGHDGGIVLPSSGSWSVLRSGDAVLEIAEDPAGARLGPAVRHLVFAVGGFSPRRMYLMPLRSQAVSAAAARA